MFSMSATGFVKNAIVDSLENVAHPRAGLAERCDKGVIDVDAAIGLLSRKDPLIRNPLMMSATGGHVVMGNA
jgi:hypothetical protein